jgi:hypothetical protein
VVGLPPAETEVVMGYLGLGLVFAFYMVGVWYWGRS